MHNQPISPLKTYKMFTGSFVRSESGRTRRVPVGNTAAEVCVASRKDVRDMVRNAASAASSWSSATPYLRGQVTYRMAEMLAGRTRELAALAAAVGLDDTAAAAVDSLVHFAGWSDKLGVVLGGTPDVPGFGVTTAPVAVGVAGVWLPDGSSLVEIVDAIAPAVAVGNAVVVLCDPATAVLASVFAEVVATSDVPAGVVSLAGAATTEPVATLAGATEVRCLDVTGHPERVNLEQLAAESVTRCRPTALASPVSDRPLDALRHHIDYRTVWVPEAR